MFPKLKDPRYPSLPQDLILRHAEEILELYPDLPRKIPLAIGGGIGQSRTLMLLLRKAHLGEVSVTVWPKILKEIARRKISLRSSSGSAYLSRWRRLPPLFYWRSIRAVRLRRED